MPFNSLFEMQDRAYATASGAGSLSILYLRCRSRLQTTSTRSSSRSFQFSIWDARRHALSRRVLLRGALSILYLRCLYGNTSTDSSEYSSTFQFSIWDAGQTRRRSYSSNSSFNSLFEMLKRIPPVEYVTQLASLSILYLRCPTRIWVSIGREYCGLSILYLRCPRVDEIVVLLPTRPFNSLFEMRQEAVWDISWLRHTTFQFSIWDASTSRRQAVQRLYIFQFSIWDASHLA